MIMILHIYLYLGSLGAGFVIWVHKSWPFCLDWCWLSNSMVAKSCSHIQSTTTNTHTTIKMSSSCCPIQQLCSLSLDRAAVPPNLGAVAPQKSIERARKPSNLCSLVSDHLFGGCKQNTSKNTERGGVLALDGCHLIEGHKNQLKVSSGGGRGIGEEAQQGENVWGIAKPSFRSSNWVSKKKWP